MTASLESSAIPVPLVSGAREIRVDIIVVKCIR